MDTKSLRQKILDLAIRGKLVPQDPNDEPASVLLERIRAEKQQMVKDGKLKLKDIKNDTIIFKGEDNLHYEKFHDGSEKCIEDEIPFKLPVGWAFLRLQSFVSFIGGNQPPKSTFEYKQTPNNIRLIQIRDYKSNKFKTFIPKDKAKRFCNANDIMIGRYGPPIFQILRGLDGAYNVALMKAVPDFNIMSNDYLYYLLQDGELLFMLEGLSDRTCGQDGINIYELNRYIVGIPPISEQKRIVEFLNNNITTADYIENEKNELLSFIQLTKSKILDLAIRGKLVPQDPNDEPASVLLERIRNEKEELIKQGKIKRDKKESVIFKDEDNSYYQKIGNLVEKLDDWKIDDLPETWGLCCLGEVCDYGNCTNVDTKDISDTAWILDLEDIEKDTGKVLQKLTKKERSSASTKHLFYKGQVLYSKLRPYLNKVVLADNDGYCTSEILPLDFNACILPEYAKYYLMSPTFLRYTNHCSYGVKMPRLGTQDGKNAVLTVPPINEQKRIANKISQLFSILDFIAENIN